MPLGPNLSYSTRYGRSGSLTIRRVESAANDEDGNAGVAPNDLPAPLRELLEIESVSSDPEHAGEVERAARWVLDYMGPTGGAWEMQRPPGAVHPVVVGRLKASPTSSEPAPHVLLYGHFDVLPAGPEGWETPPFSPTVIDGWVRARGAGDSKSNCYAMLTAVRDLVAAERLPVDLTIVCDGEEEIDGVAAEACMREIRGVDGAIVFDGGMWRRGLPTFVISARGQVSYRITVDTGREELHSGRYGGVAMNAVHALISALDAATKVADELGGGLRPDRADVEVWDGLEGGDEVLAQAGAIPADDTAETDFYARTEFGASVDVNGIEGGEPGQQKSIVPVTAHAYLSIRVPPGREIEEADAALRRALAAGAPPRAALSIERLGSVPAAAVDRDSAAVRCAAGAMREVFGVDPLVVRSGVSIGVLGALAAQGVPTVMTGFSLPESRVHAANERFPLEHLALGVEATAAMLLSFAELPRGEAHR